MLGIWNTLCSSFFSIPISCLNWPESCYVVPCQQKSNNVVVQNAKIKNKFRHFFSIWFWTVPRQKKKQTKKQWFDIHNSNHRTMWLIYCHDSDILWRTLVHHFRHIYIYIYMHVDMNDLKIMNDLKTQKWYESWESCFCIHITFNRKTYW